MAHALQVGEEFVTPEEYLAREPLHQVKHEYLGGVVYEMAGASEAHNIIAINLTSLLHAASFAATPAIVSAPT